MKIGILYIALGKYDVFWKGFYESSEKYFMKNHEKHYFVFTDVDNLYKQEMDNVHIDRQENLGWPKNTLLRFHMFEKMSDKLKEMDYLFFFNANLEFQKEVQEEFLSKEDLVVVKHPGFSNVKSSLYYPYCRQKKSLAYIPYGKGKVYVQGALNGGKTEPFLKMIHQLVMNIEKDLEKGIIAEVHDESHLNKYLMEYEGTYRLLGTEYVYPQGWEHEGNAKIISRDKARYFDVISLKKKSLQDWIRIIKNKIIVTTLRYRYGRQ